MSGSGINDDLDGSERHKPVGFHVANLRTHRGVQADTSAMHETHGFDAEVVESLAKWKRTLLKRYECEVGEGLYCESTSIRKGYFGDCTHSNICDQWDWEIRITREQRTLEHLKAVVRRIYGVLRDVQDAVLAEFPALDAGGAAERLPEQIHFITAEDLHARYPGQDVHDREDSGVREFGAIFIIGMGWPMSDGTAPEEVRAPDYDDWNLNGDIIVRHPVTGYRHELSSMGIRVDAASMRKQLEHRCGSSLEFMCSCHYPPPKSYCFLLKRKPSRAMLARCDLPYHKAVLGDELPFCIGGGLGISRLCMLLLRTGHIGEVQAGVWHPQHVQEARQHGMELIPTV